VIAQYAANEPVGGGDSPASCCKIKHDVSKFVGVFASVVALNESGTLQEDTLEKALDLYRVK